MSDLRRLSRTVSLAFLAMFVAWAFPATAQSPFDTLERIRKEGVLRLGVGSNPPFAYRDASGQPIGYSVDLCRLVAEDIRRQLGLGHIDLVYVERTPIDRVQLLNNGRYDLECDASTNTEERRRSVAFALAHFFTETRYVALASENLYSVDDLRGRSVAAALGTVNIGQIGILNRERQLQLSLVPASSLQKAFDLVTRRRASAFVMDAVLLRSMVAATGKPGLYAISREPVSEVRAYGFMMRREDTAFHAAVNAALKRIYASPEMTAIYDRWFRSPLPGLNYGLDEPMSPELAAHLASFR